jgi:heptosyltransferase-3
LTNPKKILIIIQRSNGDVFLSASLINRLSEYYNSLQIDLLVNDDTIEVAKLLPNINHIHTFSYNKKKSNKLKQERSLISAIYKKYDLSISLTASDRSVFYAFLSGKKSISAIDQDSQKAWWKKIILNSYYYFDVSKHILLNNLEPLNLLHINHDNVHDPIFYSLKATDSIKKKLAKKNISNFLIFHPSAQYQYKIYPRFLRDQLLTKLNSLGLPILITGTKNKIDLAISKEIPSLSNIYNLIGETTLEEYFALSDLALAYVGMDTLNMHIAASQNKRIFTIFGPTNLKMWSPWSNDLKASASLNKPIQNYGEITIFQSNLPCVACGNAGCNNLQGRSECLHVIDPNKIFNEVKNWYLNVRL